MRVFKGLENLAKFNNAIITIGTFDGVHKGHQKLLSRIQELAKEKHGESALITFHPHPRFVIQPGNKELKLLNSLEEKIALLETFGLDNLIVASFDVAFSQMPALAYIKDFLVRNFQPHTIVIGYDHHFGINRSGNIDLLKEYQNVFGYQVEEISKETLKDIGISSTKIRKALVNGEVSKSNELMGHNYTLSGFVTKGKQIGRTLDYPTANLQLTDAHKLVPKNGVYAVKVSIQREVYSGMLNIGFRPTVAGAYKTVEVNIFDFNRDIYGEKIKIELLQFIRDEVKFESLELLKTQIGLDKKEVISYLERLP